MISKKDVENVLGSSINNLMFYNTKKWAIMRSTIFKDFTSFDINRIIIAFQPFFVNDKAALDPNIYSGLIICLEGQINNKS